MKVLAPASITAYLNALGLVGHFGCSGFGITATYTALSAPLFSLLNSKVPGNPHGLPGGIVRSDVLVDQCETAAHMTTHLHPT